MTPKQYRLLTTLMLSVQTVVGLIAVGYGLRFALTLLFEDTLLLKDFVRCVILGIASLGLGSVHLKLVEWYRRK